MRYVHGTDEKRRDLVRIWTYRALFLFFLLFFLVLAAVFVLCVRELFFSPDPQGSPHAAGEYLVLVMLAVILVIFYWAMRGCVWRNARYTLDGQGITMIELRLPAGRESLVLPLQPGFSFLGRIVTAAY